MTAYQLRRHLGEAHGVTMRGAAFDILIMVHQNEHEPACEPDHTHEDGE